MTIPSSNAVKILNTAINRAISPNIIVGYSPRVVVISPKGDNGYVNNYGDGTVSVFNTKTNLVTATVSLIEYEFN